MAKISDYEKEREANIARNKALLASLGCEKPTTFDEPKEVRRPKKTAASKKRKAEPTTEETGDQSVPKIARTDSDNDGPSSGTRRRSARNAGKTVDYKSEQLRSLPAPLTGHREEGTGNEGPLRSGSGINKIVKFGPIPDIEVGTWWQSREDCSNDSIHAPWVAGISGGKAAGAYSIALSGGYDDDVDLGYAFTYTGAGGRDLKGTKDKPKNLRTAPQSSDQTYENNSNAALKKSLQTGKPIRVVRGYKCPSKYAPSEGYRYDGLYKIEKTWREPGLNEHGYLVCKFAFKRIGGQPPIPVRDMGAQRNESQEEGSEAEADEEADEEAEMPEEEVKNEPLAESKSNPIDADPEVKDQVTDASKEQIAQKSVMDEAKGIASMEGSPDVGVKAEAGLAIKEGVTEDQPGASTLTDGVKGEAMAMAVDAVSI